MAGSSRSRRSYDDRPSEFETDETSSEEYSPGRSSRKPIKDRSHSSKRKTSRHNRRRSRRDRNSSDEYSDEGSARSARSSRKKKSSRNITEDEIAEYMAKKAQKKVLLATYIRKDDSLGARTQAAAFFISSTKLDLVVFCT